MRSRSLALIAGAIALAIVAVAAALLRPQEVVPVTPEQRASAGRDLAGHVTVSVTVVDSVLAVTRASGDFGIEEGVRSVPVRLVDDLTVRIRIVSDVDLRLAGPPRVCLVGPFWNPLDAGLSDRCWGEPDLASLVAELLAVASDGTVTAEAGVPIELSAAIGRGSQRCDYSPGEWRLQVDAEPVVDGTTVGRVDLANLPFEVPLEPDGTVLPFHPNAETRPCSYPAAVFTRQGEPRFEDR